MKAIPQTSIIILAYNEEKGIAYELEQFLFRWIKDTDCDYRQHKDRSMGIIKEY